MTNCNKQTLLFPELNHKKIEVEFTGGDGGVLLLREMDRCLQLTPAFEEIVKIESKNNFNCFPTEPVVTSGGLINFDYCSRVPLTF